MSGGAPSNTTSTTELPGWAQPYAQSLLQRGASLSDQTMPVYNGQRSADLNGYQTTGMDMVANRAINGSAEVQAGSNQLQNTVNGGYLGYSPGQNQYQGQNPYLQSMIDKSARGITQQYNTAVQGNDATFARAGAFGGSAWQNAQTGAQRQLAQGLADSSDNLNFQNYNQSAQLAESGLNRSQNAFQTERGNQMAGTQQALAYGQQPYQDAAQLSQAGTTQYGFDQQGLTDQMNQFNEYAQSPYKQLDILGNTIRGAVGGGGTVSQAGPGTNPYAQAAGGAAALAGLLGK